MMIVRERESYSEPVLTAHELLRDITGIAVSGRVICQKPADGNCPD